MKTKLNYRLFPDLNSVELSRYNRASDAFIRLIHRLEKSLSRTPYFTNKLHYHEALPLELLIKILALKNPLDNIYAFLFNLWHSDKEISETEIDLLSKVIASKHGIDYFLFKSHLTSFFDACKRLRQCITEFFEQRINSEALVPTHTAGEKQEGHLLTDLYHHLTQFHDLVSATTTQLCPSNINPRLRSLLYPPHTPSQTILDSLPRELQLMIFSQLGMEDLLTVQTTSQNWSAIAAIAFADRFKKNPAQVIAHLSQAKPEEAYEFINGYRRTSEYKALYSLVATGMPMSNLEIACYLLTRHDEKLPAITRILETWNDASLAPEIRMQLSLIVKHTPEIKQRAGKSETLSMPHFMSPHQLFDLYLTTFPGRYLNILPSIYFNQINLAGAVLSFAPLAHVTIHGRDLSKARLVEADLRYARLASSQLQSADLSHANLHHANLEHSSLVNAMLENTCLTGANLSHVNLSRATLKKADLRGANLTGSYFMATVIDGADFTGANLSHASFIDVDLRCVDLSQINLEWSYLHKVRLIPDTVVKSTARLENFFNTFEKMLLNHSEKSRNKLRRQMLKELKSLLINAFLRTKKKRAWVNLVFEYYPPSLFKDDSFLKTSHPFKALFEEFQRIEVKRSPKKINLPLHNDVVSVFAELQSRIINADSDIKAGDLIHPLKQIMRKVPESTNISQISSLSNQHLFLLHVLYYSGLGIYERCKPLKPLMVNYPSHSLDEQPRHSCRFASEIFDGELFKLEKLQHIKPEDFTSTALYGDEDFIIKTKKQHKKRVKLGGLWITYTNYLAGETRYMTFQVDTIDFQNKQIKPGFIIDLKPFPNLSTEQFLPLCLGNIIGRMGHDVFIPLKIIPLIRAGFHLKKRLINYIFATQKGPIPQCLPFEVIQPIETEKEPAQNLTLENRPPNRRFLPDNPYSLFSTKAIAPLPLAAEESCCLIS